MSLNRVSVSRLTELLAPAIGDEKAKELVLETARQSGYAGDDFSYDQAMTLLEVIGKSPGVIGVAARFATKRIGNRPEAELRQRPSAPAPPVLVSTVNLQDMIDVLARSLGKEKSEEVVSAAATQLGILGDKLPREKALLLLEHLAIQPGLVGVTARFAKTRFILRFAS